jgi:hypothetical protein
VTKKTGQVAIAKKDFYMVVGERDFEQRPCSRDCSSASAIDQIILSDRFFCAFLPYLAITPLVFPYH